MTISVLYLVYPKQYCALVLPSPAMEKMILSICELEITSVLRSSASVVAVTWNRADPQILTCHCWKGQRLTHLGSSSIRIFIHAFLSQLLVFTIISIAHEGTTITLVVRLSYRCSKPPHVEKASYPNPVTFCLQLCCVWLNPCHWLFSQSRLIKHQFTDMSSTFELIHPLRGCSQPGSYPWPGYFQRPWRSPKVNSGCWRFRTLLNTVPCCMDKFTAIYISIDI